MKCTTYPVDLVQVIRLEHNTADNTSTGGSLHLDFGSTPEEVVSGLKGGSVTLLLNDELGTVGSICNGARGDIPATLSAGSEITAEGSRKGRVIRAGCG